MSKDRKTGLARVMDRCDTSRIRGIRRHFKSHEPVNGTLPSEKVIERRKRKENS